MSLNIPQNVWKQSGMNVFSLPADEAIDLDILLDDTIVETTWRRRTYPKQILPHVVHSLKAERKLMVGVPGHLAKS